jgi:hypothetical protein
MPSQSSSGTSVANFTPPARSVRACATDNVASMAKQKMVSSIRRMRVPHEDESGFFEVTSTVTVCIDDW